MVKPFKEQSGGCCGDCRDVMFGCLGYFCGNGTKHATENPCPRGTFNNVTHRTVVDDCQPCLGGMYCDQEGLTYPTADCAPGKIKPQTP